VSLYVNDYLVIENTSGSVRKFKCDMLSKWKNRCFCL